MQIKFKGQYDKKLFYNAVRLANQPGRSSRLMYILVGMVFGVMTITTTREIIGTGDFAGSIIEIALLLLMAFILYQAYVPPYLGARKMWETTSVQRPLSGYATKNGITYNFPQGDKSYTWSDFNRVRKVGGLVTLISIRGMLLIFPRHFFKNETNWERFTKLVDTNVVFIKKK